MNATVTCTYANGRPLEELGRLIEKRAQVMNQTTEKAVTAIAITAIKSLRAATNKSKGQIKPIVEKINGELQIAVEACANLFPSWKWQSGKRLPCIREGNPKGSCTSIKPWWKVQLKNLDTAKVFKVTLSPDRGVAWPKSKLMYYIVAYDIDYAKNLVTSRYNKIVKRYSGLGQDAWSRAMMLVSDRPANFVAGAKAKSILNSTVSVSKTQNMSGIGSGSYTVIVEDNLRFAGKALKGGEAYVNTALMKAANSINANINNYIDSHQGNGNWFAEQNWQKAEAPFPPDAFGE